MLLELSNAPLPSGLLVVPTLVESGKSVFPVQVMNFTQEDLWLQPRTKLGLLSVVGCVDVATEVCFNHISADHEEVSVEVKEIEASESKMQPLLEHLNVGTLPEEQAKLATLLTQFSDIFVFKDED